MSETLDFLIKEYIESIVDATGYQAQAIQRNDVEYALMWERYIVRLVSALSGLGGLDD